MIGKGGRLRHVESEACPCEPVRLIPCPHCRMDPSDTRDEDCSRCCGTGQIGAYNTDGFEKLGHRYGKGGL